MENVDLPRINCFTTFNETQPGGVNSVWPGSQSRRQTAFLLESLTFEI